MSRFQISPGMIYTDASDIRTIGEEMSEIVSRVSGLASEIHIGSGSDAAVRSSLRAQSRNIEDGQISVKAMGDGLERIARIYENADRKVADTQGTGSGIQWEAVSAVVAKPATDPATNDAEKGSENPLSEAVKKAIRAALGPFGSLISIVDYAQDGAWGGIFSEIMKNVGKVAKNIKGSSVDWKGVFGLAVSDKTPWQQALGKYFDFSSAGKSVSSICNWVAELGKAAYNNYKEFGTIAEGRFWEETAAESLLKIGEGVLITAGVAAAFAAVGITAPGLAVGAAAAGIGVLVDAGLDAVVTWATNGSQTSWLEFASDGICDFGEAAADAVKKTAKKAAEAAKHAGEKIADGVERASQGIRNAFGSVTRWGIFAH